MHEYNLSADPYEGARQAFFVLNATATDEEWERWIADHANETERNFDNFEALAWVCRQAFTENPELNTERRHLIIYAHGYFEAMETVVRAMWFAQPLSSSNPMQTNRYQMKILRKQEQL